MVLVALLGVSVAAYLVGAVPVGVLLGKLMRGVDIREFGSGKTGATNVLRTLGWAPAVATLLGDIAKGSIGVLLGRFFLAGFGYEVMTAGEVAGALAAIVGHNWPLYVGFRGGRGVATTLGATIVLSPFTAIIGVPIAFAIIVISDMASLGSLLATLAGLTVLGSLILFGQHAAVYGVFATVAGGMIVWQHRDNIGRLLRGEERKLGILRKRSPAVRPGEHITPSDGNAR